MLIYNFITHAQFNIILFFKNIPLKKINYFAITDSLYFCHYLQTEDNDGYVVKKYREDTKSLIFNIYDAPDVIKPPNGKTLDSTQGSVT